MGEMSTDAGDSSEEVLLASVQDDLVSNLPAEGLPPSSDMPYERTDSSTSEQEGSIDAVASSKEAITARVQDDADSKLAADDSLPSSNMAPEPRDPAAISKATDELHEHTIEQVKLKTILESVNKGGLMDTDTFNFAIRNMAREKSSDGGLENSKHSCRKHYVTADFAMGAILYERDDDPESVQKNVDNVLNKDFQGLDDNIDVLCIPVIHLGHWTLYAYDMKNGVLSILDSMKNESYHKEIPVKIGEALERVQTDYNLFKNKSNFSLWLPEFPRVPQQGHGTNDCGFFVFKFMRQWNGHELVGLISQDTMELRNEFLAYIHSFNLIKADPKVHYPALEETLEVKQELSGSDHVNGVTFEETQERTRDLPRPPDPKVHYPGLEKTLELKQELPGSATTTSVPSTSRDIDSARPPLYKFIPVTKILVEPCKELKSPFLVKRQSFCRPDANILENLYQDITADKLHIWQGPGDIQKLMKDGQSMDAVCLNLAVNNMGRQDAQDFRNTKCLGWRHYVDSDWAKNSLGGCSDLKVLHFCFHRGSILYNASQSHVVFIPVVIHGAHWSLYAFNMCDRKLSILDSLPDTTEGVDSDPAERHQRTRCDVCDALTITMNFAIDFRSWEYEFPKLPRQRNSYDSGFFVLNFMRLWDGCQLVRGFSTESKELRKDFLAYILTCKDNNVHLPNEVLLKIKDLPGKMMDCTMQKVAREGSTLRGFLDGGLPGSSSTRKPSQPQASKTRRLRALPESLSFFWKLTKHVLRPKNQQEHGDVVSSNNATSDQMIIDVIAALASSDFLPFLSTCHRVTSDGDGMLHIAARFGNVVLVHDILDNHGALAALLVTAVNNIGDTVLHCAAAGGCDEIVKLFVEDMGSSMFLRAQNLKGETCLHEAVRHGHVGIVETLILEDSKIPDLGRPRLVQIVNNAGISPLYLATTLRRIEIVQTLTEKLYRQDDKYAASFAGPAGKTALHAAVVLLDKELIAILLDWNASLTSQGDESGSTPLHYLASLCLERTEPNSLVLYLYRSRNMRIAGTTMVAHPAQDMARMIVLLCITLVLCLYKRAQRSGVLYKPLQYSDNTWKLVQDSGTIELVLRKDPLSALYVDCTGSLPIHIAAAHGRLDTVKKLLEECPCCDSSRNASGQTILHIAVEKENLSLVRYVCGENKFNRILNMEDQDGNTALHLAVNNASEKIFCTLMQNRDVCLNYANKRGHTPLDLAFLSLHPELKRMQGPREWIFFDLLHGGGDFGVCSWDHLTSNVAEADWEKESESVGKSASMMAVCAVLIMNASLLTPFQVLNHNQKENPLVFHGARFQAFVLFDTISFVCSAAATYFCACAGFTMSDGSMRLKNLITGTYALVVAALTWICTVALALFLVLPGQTFFRPIVVAGACVLGFMLLSFAVSKFVSFTTHLAAIRARVGDNSRVNFLLLIGRNAIKPLWVVPSASKVLYLSVGLGLIVFIYQLPFLARTK